MRRSSSTTGPTWATRWSCTTDACRALISAEHQGRAGTEGFRPALSCSWPRWCSGRRRARPLCVPVGGGPPASRPRDLATELRSAPRLEARPCPPVPPAPSTPAAPVVLVCPARPRRRPPAPRQVPPAPLTPAVPVVLVCPGPAVADGRRSLASGPPGASHAGGACASGMPRPRRRRRAPQPAQPPTLTNFARNSPATVSNLECASLELQRFRRLLKLLSIELRASFLGPAVCQDLRQPVQGGRSFVHRCCVRKFAQQSSVWPRGETKLALLGLVWV